MIDSEGVSFLVFGILLVDFFIFGMRLLDLSEEVLPLDCFVGVRLIVTKGEYTSGWLCSLVHSWVPDFFVVHQQKDFLHLSLWVLHRFCYLRKALLGQFEFFRFKNSCNVQLVQFFVYVVNAKLLEIIVCKVFESKDVQETNGLGDVFEAFFILVQLLGFNCLIHLDDEPVEHVIVQLL